MRIVVAIPAFRAVALIRETLLSVTTQTHSDWSCVVVIDGDDDGTVDEAMRICDPRIRCVSDGIRRGQLRNFNHAILESLRDKPAAIRLLSADDVLYPHALCDAARLLETHRYVGLVANHFDIIDAEGHLRYAADVANCPDRVMSGKQYLWKGVAVGNTIGGPSSVTIRAEVIETAGMFDATMNYAGDQEFWHRIAASWDVAWVGYRAGFKYRQHAGSVTQLERASASRFTDKVASVRRVVSKESPLGWRWWLLQYTIGWLHAINLHAILLMAVRGQCRSAWTGLRTSFRQGLLLYIPFWLPRIPWQLARRLFGKDPFRRVLWRRVHESLQPPKRLVPRDLFDGESTSAMSDTRS